MFINVFLEPVWNVYKYVAGTSMKCKDANLGTYTCRYNTILQIDVTAKSAPVIKMYISNQSKSRGTIFCIRSFYCFKCRFQTFTMYEIIMTERLAIKAIQYTCMQ